MTSPRIKSPLFLFWLIFSRGYLTRLRYWLLSIGRFSTPRPDDMTFSRWALDEVLPANFRRIWVHLHRKEDLDAITETLTALHAEAQVEFLFTYERDIDFEKILALPFENMEVKRAPYATADIVARFLDIWQPDFAIWASAKLSPRIFYEVNRAQIPFAWMGAGPSQRRVVQSCLIPRYLQDLLRHFDLIICDSKNAEKRLLGFGADINVVKRLTQFKADYKEFPDDTAYRARWSSELKTRQVLLATMVQRHEIDFVVRAYREAKKRSQRLLLAMQIEGEVDANWRGNMHVIDEGDIPSYGPDIDVILIDIKNLGTWYRIAPLTYLGGNFRSRACVNPYEVAALGSAMISGPNWIDFHSQFSELIDQKAIRVVKTPARLDQEFLATSAVERTAELALRAWYVVTQGESAVTRAVTFLLETADIPRIANETT